MQAEATFSGNKWVHGTAMRRHIHHALNIIDQFKNFVESGAWEKRFLTYEKHLNRFSWYAIAASVVFFVPVCVKILTR
ncbi:MAG: hypothetical protein KBA28_12770 [Syntrophaceae bacterium]|jgi:hypothetical protein|nr:hypothetical protein [Syntrophaceae bacterium]HOC58984.1 hypothetical protein [Smithellaceae bacterium]HQM44892.1 hypothetical protein [Smithellaceae bacterium]